MKILGVNIGGSSKRTTNLQDQQANIGNEQQQAFSALMPQYMKGLDFLSNYAGLGDFHPAAFGSYGAGAQPGTMPPSPYHQQALGGMYNPTQPQPGWNWNASGVTPPPPPTPAPMPGTQAYGYMNTPGLNPNMSGGRQALNLSGQGDGNAMGPNPYGKGDGIPSLPGVNPAPPQPPAPPQAQAPAQTAAAPMAQRPMSRQRQFIQGNPGLGAFNPAQSGSQNVQQIHAAPPAVQQSAQMPSQAAGAMGPSPYLQGQQATGGVSNSQMGIFNDPADALRNAQAQDDINHNNALNQQNYKAQMGERGLEDSSILGGGLSRMNQDANQQYAGYRRNLAMNAGQEQMNRVLQFMQQMQGGLGMGQAAQSNYGQMSQALTQQQQAQQQALAGYGQMLGQAYYGGY